MDRKKKKKSKARIPIRRTSKRSLSTPAGNTAAAAEHDSPVVPPPPAVRSEPFFPESVIEGSTVLTILANQISRFTPAGQFQSRTIISDNAYHPVPLDFVRSAILTDPVLSPASYHADVFDCDDYVQYLKAKMSLYAASKKFAQPLAVGYLLTVLHAFTICILEPGALALINTQSANGDAPYELDEVGFQQFLQFSPQNPITSIYI